MKHTVCCDSRLVEEDDWPIPSVVFCHIWTGREGLTARGVRREAKRDGWRHLRYAGHLIDLCPACLKQGEPVE